MLETMRAATRRQLGMQTAVAFVASLLMIPLGFVVGYFLIPLAALL